MLSNNHSLDFGPFGLSETLSTLHDENIQTAGAGEDRTDARRPASFRIDDDRRPFIMGACARSAGVPSSRKAGEGSPGVYRLDEISEQFAMTLAELILSIKSPSDILVLSIHWGGNWGYEVPDRQRSFTHSLINSGTVDLIHDHSSHHVKGFEVYDERLILYGCGDFLTDYEGISGHEQYRDDLGLMYFPVLDPETGQLKSMTMIPTQLGQFRLKRPGEDNLNKLESVLRRELDKFNIDIKRTQEQTFMVED